MLFSTCHWLPQQSPSAWAHLLFLSFRVASRSLGKPLLIKFRQELRVLGRGGFGLAVAAVNRLDGRQYAVKKIAMSRRAFPTAAQIIAEVNF